MSSIRDEEDMPMGQRICFGVVGMALSVAALVLGNEAGYEMGARKVSASLGLGGIAFVVVAIVGKRGTGGVEYLGLAPEACPKCEQQGTLEIYNQETTEDIPGLFSKTTVTTTTPMIKCMNTKCSYQRKFKLHQQDTKHRRRREAVATMTTTDAVSKDAPTNTGSAPAAEQRAWQVADALEEAERRQELRRKKLDRKGKIEVHPETQRLQAGFGSCPDCNGPVKFKRWIRKFQAGPLSPPVVVESLSLAECSKTKSCGYIAKINLHKKRVRQSASASASRTNKIVGRAGEGDLEMQPLMQ